MPNAQACNYALASNTDRWSAIWKLTRVLKAAGWRYKASSDGTNKETTGNPNNDKWGAGVQVGAQTATAAFTIGAPSTSAKAGRSTISGLTGFTTSSPGHYLKITGATNSANNGTWLITKYNSATSVDIENPAAVSETTPGTATWTELDAALDTIPAAIATSSGSGAWWCAEGPATMKIPIGTGVPTGTFVRGENVTQATSGATGELLGVMTDASGGTGYLVISPRVSGSGAAVRGWDSSHTITGTTSGATITPTGTPLEYIREIVIWKNSTSQGHMYQQVIDSVNESTPGALIGRFSSMATLSGCTATICPGGATGGVPSSNGFPTTGTMVAWGTGGSGAVGTGAASWLCCTGNVATWGAAQLLAANNIEDANISADGSFIVAIGTPAAGTPATFNGYFFMRLDDQEEGDIDPYVHWVTTNSQNYDGSRTVRTATGATAGFNDVWNSGFWGAVNYTPFRGWRRRGFSSGDVYQEFQGAILGMWNTTQILAINTGTFDRVATAPVNTAVREPIWVVSSQFGQKQRKGTLRWVYAVGGGAGTDTYDTKRWVQLSSASVPSVAGPWDGSTTPSNS